MNDVEREKFEELKELNLILTKFGRRVVHDMAHMHDNLCPHREIFPSSEEWSDKIDMWKSVFYPDDGRKDYRLQMHQEMDDLERQIRGYQKILYEHNIPDPYFMIGPDSDE